MPALRDPTKRRLERIIDTAYYLLILVAFYLFMSYAFWLVFPFMFAFFLAAIMQRPMNFAHRKLKIKKKFSAIMLVLLFYLVIVSIIAAIGMQLWASATNFASFVTAQAQNLPEIIIGLAERVSELIRWLPAGLQENINTWLTYNVTTPLTYGDDGGVLVSLVSNIDIAWFRAPIGGVLNVAGRIPAVAIAAVITVISSFFMTTGYDDIVRFIKRQLPQKRQDGLSAAKRILFSSLGKLLKAYTIIMVSTAAQVAIGLTIMRLIGIYTGNYLWAIVAVVAVLDFLPAVGAGFVLTPWALYSLIMGQFWLALGLILIYVTITIVHQIVEPKVMAANLGLPPVVTIAAMYIGLQLFGIIGILLAPILMTLLKVLNDEGVIKIWK
ncbi:MAG: AI-2E family transporter [Oscillospiraceae bacterium]|nr:AI-2E family transporter [Oscillospiraceae bacterium]